MTTTEITPALHYLEGKDLENFTIEVESVQRKLKDAWRDTLDAMQDLERIRWGAKWLDDPIWKEWDEAAQRHGAKRAERSWFSWLGRRGGFSWNERELTDQETYQRLLATWVLTVAIEIHNARVVEGEKAPATVAGAFEAELLPPAGRAGHRLVALRLHQHRLEDQPAPLPDHFVWHQHPGSAFRQFLYLEADVDAGAGG